jgi:hypothetical protein
MNREEKNMYEFIEKALIVIAFIFSILIIVMPLDKLKKYKIAKESIKSSAFFKVCGTIMLLCCILYFLISIKVIKL